jgi:hypothetical protein
LTDRGIDPYISNTGKMIVLTKTNRSEGENEESSQSQRLIFSIKGELLAEVIHNGSVDFSDTDKYVLFLDRKNTGFADIMIYNTITKKVEYEKKKAFSNTVFGSMKEIRISEKERKVVLKYNEVKQGKIFSFPF